MHARTLGTHRDSINLVVDSPALPCDPGLVVIFIILHAKQRPLDKMFCCFCGNCVEAAFVYCPSCGRKQGDASGANANMESVGPKRKEPSVSHPQSFSSFMKKKEGERQSHFQPNKKKTRSGETKIKAKDEVLINVGLMEYDCGEQKPLRGKSFPVKLSKDMGYDEVMERSLKKWEDYDRTFSRDGGYVLVYQDGKLARKIPGSSEEFTLRKYKEGLGKSYARIFLYLCPATEKKSVKETPPITNWLSEEEAEIIDSEDSFFDGVDLALADPDVTPVAVPITPVAVPVTPLNEQHEFQSYMIADFL